MKKSLLALAVLGAFASVAQAQSSVTLFGVLDLNVQSIKNGDKSQKKMGADGINSNRIGFRGVEDLGGGLRAGFHLEGGLDPGAGIMGGGNGLGAAPAGAGQSASFNRRSTVSLMGNWGEVRLGRDYTAGFWNTTIFDPFGTNGVGSYLNVGVNALGSNAASGGGVGVYVRSNNMIGYFLPGGLGGLYGQFQIGAPEGNNGQKLTSGRLGWAGGPVDIAASFQTAKTTPVDWKHNNIGGSYDLGIAKLMAFWDSQKSGSLKQTTYLLGAVVPMGQMEWHVSYDHAKVSGVSPAPSANQWAFGGVYSLSKRTALYGTYSHISNKNGAAFVVTATNNGGNSLNKASSGYEFGVRHFF